MKIDRIAASRRSTAKRSEASGTGSSGGFAKVLSEQAPQSVTVGGGVGIGAVDSLLALQEVPDSTMHRRRSLRRGQDLLDELEELRIGLLMGHFPASNLERISKLLAHRDDASDDPKLVELINEIEIRVAVELAKLGR